MKFLCPTCTGTGIISNPRKGTSIAVFCQTCGGTGWIENQKVVWKNNEEMIKDEEELYK